MKRFIPLFVPLLLLPSCGALAGLQQADRLDKVDRTLEKVGDGLTEVVETVTELRQIQTTARAQADVNQDGKLDPTEMLTYGGLVAAALAEMARRKLKAVEGKAEEANGRVEFERAKRKAAEAKEIEALRAAAAAK